jgi:hypothetical protein
VAPPTHLAALDTHKRETRRVSNGTLVIVLVVCLVVAVGGFFTSIRLVKRVRTKAEAANAELADER